MNNYIKPVTRIVTVATQQMIAQSIGITGTQKDNTAALGKEGFFGWEEEEDDEPMGMPEYNIWED